MSAAFENKDRISAAFEDNKSMAAQGHLHSFAK